MAVFQADVIICATMYVQAASAQEAFDKVEPHHFTDLELPDRPIASWLDVSGATLDSEDLPEISLSPHARSEEHTSELQSLMRISYAVFCLKQKKDQDTSQNYNQRQRTQPVCTRHR